MIVAVPLVRMMQMSLHEIVFMAALRNRFMSAIRPVSVLRVMCPTHMTWCASRRIRAALCQSMFVNVPLMGAVKMAVVQVIDVTFVFHRGVPAA